MVKRLKFDQGNIVVIKEQPVSWMFPIGTVGMVIQHSILGLYVVRTSDDSWVYKEEQLELADQRLTECVEV